mgnify:FL=1
MNRSVSNVFKTCQKISGKSKNEEKGKIELYVYIATKLIHHQRYNMKDPEDPADILDFTNFELRSYIAAKGFASSNKTSKELYKLGLRLRLRNVPFVTSMTNRQEILRRTYEDQLKRCAISDPLKLDWQTIEDCPVTSLPPVSWPSVLLWLRQKSLPELGDDFDPIEQLTSQERLKGVNYAVNRVASAKKVCDNDKTIVAFEIIRSQSLREEPFFVWFVISSEITGGYCSCIR